MSLSLNPRWIAAGGIVLAVLLLAASIAAYRWAASIYDSNFDQRYTTSPADAFVIEDFPYLHRTRHTFTSNDGQMLVGYFYNNPLLSARKKAVVIFAHGLGSGGQRGYMEIFDFLANHGYTVFAYDATGNDESEGAVVGGLPQGVIDLKYAIDYVRSIETLRDCPILLMGYSWGAYSVSNVLNYHPDVKAVAALAGFNRSTDLMEDRGKKLAGKWAGLLLPFASMHEYAMYGNYAFCTAMRGFANSDCQVMIVHGERDTTVPIQYGYETYYRKYGSDPRFTFKKYPSRDHGILENSVGYCDFELLEEITAFFDKALSD